MTDKKSYNPFKMWGSWVGGIAGVAIWWLTFFNPIIYLIPKGSGGFSLLIFIYLLTFVLYFLLGWAIHSLFRRLKK